MCLCVLCVSARVNVCVTHTGSAQKALMLSHTGTSCMLCVGFCTCECVCVCVCVCVSATQAVLKKQCCCCTRGLFQTCEALLLDEAGNVAPMCF